MVGSNRFGPVPEDVQLLIAESDPDIGGGLDDFFSMKGYQVTRVSSGGDAIKEIMGKPRYDATILAVRMPERDGFRVLRSARKQGIDAPVILISDLVESKDRIRGFRLGADDYVTKPFDLNELEARLRAVLRRSQQDADASADEETFSFDQFTVDRTSETLTENGTPLNLTDLEFQILEHLIHNRGRTVHRTELRQEVWGLGDETESRRLDRHVASLRRKIEPDPESPTYVETVHGVGFKFVG